MNRPITESDSAAAGWRVWIWAILLICLQTAVVCDADIVINEFMADNVSVTNDPQGDYDDWIEIYNSGGSPVDIGGMFITDNLLNPTKFRIPSNDSAATTISPGGFLLLWADNEPLDGTLHLGFKLSANNDDQLGLFDTDGNTLIDSIFFDPQLTDISYGRYPDGSNPWSFMADPSPGTGNTPGMAESVEFSVPGGVFTNSFTLQLNATNSPTAVIHYTLDGSIPTNTSAIYSVPLSITGTTRVRSRVFDPGLSPGPIVSHTYLFLNADVVDFDSNLPIVLLDTYGYDIDAESASATEYPLRPVYSVFIDTNATGRAAMTSSHDFAGSAGMKIRGKSSADNFPKKSYGFEVWDENDEDKSVSIFGFPSESDWILHGPYSDKTLMRNFVTFKWSSDIGRYAVRTLFVEVYVNQDGGTPLSTNHYRGIYVFMEKIKGDRNRLAIAKLQASDTNAFDITGGYIIRQDKADTGETGFTTANQGIALLYSEPDERDMTNTFTAQAAYIQSYMDDFETALYGASFTDPTNGYAQYVDVGSWIDYHTMVELTKNIDAYSFSLFMFKDRGGKLNMGPVWDYNLSLANGGLGAPFLAEPTGWMYESSIFYQWFPRMFQDPDFEQKYIDRWSELRKELFARDRLLGDIDTTAALLNEAQARNFVQWPILGTEVWGNPAGSGSLNTYQKQIDNMKDWVSNRLDWIDGMFLAAPAFNQDGGLITNGFPLTMTAPGGTIYYTIDGMDPRASGGSVDAGAQTYSGAVTLSANTVVRARTRDLAWSNGTAIDSVWSGLTEAVFVVTPPELAITEIMYHPRAPQPGTPETNYVTADFEFIELQNIGAQTHSLLGVKLIDGVLFDFTYGNMTNLAANDFVIAVNNLAAFTNRYTNWATMNIAGEYEGNLNDGGENVMLTNWGLKSVMISFDYEDDWYPSTDGEGFSLTILDPAGNTNNWDTKVGWRHSAYLDGSPGADDSGSVLYVPGTIVINEALTHQDTEPPGDWIELYNTTTNAIDISDWYLSDSKVNLTKFRIPSSTVISGNGYRVFTESAHFGTNILGPNGFALNEHGDEIYLSAGSGGVLAEPAYREFDDFRAAEKPVTFGRYVKTDGNADFTAMETATTNAVNSNPLIGPVVIGEILYNPTNGQHEFLELVNISGSAVDLYDLVNPGNTWKVAGVSFTFPINITISNDVVLLVRDTISPAAFRAANSVSNGVQIFNYAGALDNDKDTITVRKPGTPDEIGVPYIDVDKVKYNDSAPWPFEADGYGYSLDRINTAGYGNDVINWTTNGFGGTPGVPTVIPTTPLIFISPSTMNVSTPEDVTASNRTFDVRNIGIGTLIYSITDNSGWLDVTVTNGTSSGSSDIQTHTITFSTTSLTVGTYNAAITVSSTNAANTPVTLNLNLEVTVRETVPPGIVSVLSTNSMQIDVLFDEPVEAGAGPNGAELVSNYGVDNGVTLAGAVLGGDNMTVFLTTLSAMSEGTNYELTVDNVADRAPIPNPIVTPLTNIFQYVSSNAAPVADAGTNQTVTIQNVVMLDGSGSFDPDTKPFPITYTWSQLSGPVVTINNANSAVASFNATAAGTHIFQLDVFDGTDTGIDTVTITVLFANTIPYAESFESYVNGFQLAGTNSWYADVPAAAVVVTNDYTNTYAGLLPISGAHALGLQVDGTVTNRFKNTETTTNVWFDMMVNIGPWGDAAPPVPAPDTQIAFYVNTNGDLVVWHYDSGGGSNTWTALTETDIGSNEWFRLTVESDYARVPNGFRIYTNGTAVTNTGVWFDSAYTNRDYFTELDVSGRGDLDDLVVADYNPFSALVLWLRQYYPATNDYNGAAASDTDDDRMSAQGEYIAGTDPTDSASVFKIVEFEDDGSGQTITWLSVTGRVYSVSKSTNVVTGGWVDLTNNYSGDPSGTNLFTDGNSTNNAAFYLIKTAVP